MEGTILLWIQNNLRNDILTPVMQVITSLGDHGILGMVVTLVLLCFPKTRKAGVMMFVALFFTVLLNNVMLKNIVHRVRPFNAVDGLVLITRDPGDWSFPSGHSAVSLCVAVVVLMTAPKWAGIPSVILGALIALSRLYVGVHYPTDVLVGSLIGIGFAIASVKVIEMLERKNILKGRLWDFLDGGSVKALFAKKAAVALEEEKASEETQDAEVKE